jgi:hypothetical protein
MLSKIDTTIDGEMEAAATDDKSTKPSKPIRPVTGGDTLVTAFASIHEKSPTHLSSPLKFISLVRNYVAVYGHKKTTISTRLNRLQV